MVHFITLLESIQTLYPVIIPRTLLWSSDDTSTDEVDVKSKILMTLSLTGNPFIWLTLRALTHFYIALPVCQSLFRAALEKLQDLNYLHNIKREESVLLQYSLYKGIFWSVTVKLWLLKYIMSTHTVLRSVDKVINELLIEAKLKGQMQVNVEYIPDQLRL